MISAVFPGFDAASERHLHGRSIVQGQFTALLFAASFSPVVRFFQAAFSFASLSMMPFWRSNRICGPAIAPPFENQTKYRFLG